MGLFSLEFNLLRVFLFLFVGLRLPHKNAVQSAAAAAALASNFVTLFIWFDLILVYFILFVFFPPYSAFSALTAFVCHAWESFEGFSTAFLASLGRGHFVCLCYCLTSAGAFPYCGFISQCECVCVPDTVLFLSLSVSVLLPVRPCELFFVSIYLLFSRWLLRPTNGIESFRLNNEKYTYLFRGCPHPHTQPHTEKERERPYTVINVVIGFAFCFCFRFCCLLFCYLWNVLFLVMHTFRLSSGRARAWPDWLRDTL